MTAFDQSEQGIEKEKKLAEHNQAHVAFFKADLFDDLADAEYDEIFISGGSPRRRCMDTLIAQKIQRA